jgi:hypothetical protein
MNVPFLNFAIRPAKQVERMAGRVEELVITVNPREGGLKPVRSSKVPAGVFAA